MNLLSVTKKTKIRHRNEINSTILIVAFVCQKNFVYGYGADWFTWRVIWGGNLFVITARGYAFIADIDDRCLPAVEEGAEELQASVIRIPRNQLLTPQGNQSSGHTKKRGKLPSDAVRLMNLTAFCDYVESEGYIDSDVFTCHWAIYHDVKGFLHYSGFDIVCKTRWSNSNMLYQFIRKQYSSGKKTFFDIE